MPDPLTIARTIERAEMVDHWLGKQVGPVQEAPGGIRAANFAAPMKWIAKKKCKSKTRDMRSNLELGAGFAHLLTT